MEVTGHRDGFDVKLGGKEACLTLVANIAEGARKSRPPARIKNVAKFFADEIRTDDIVEAAVLAVAKQYHFVLFPADDPRLKQGQYGTFMKYGELLKREDIPLAVKDTLSKQMKTVDPRLHNFLRVVSQVHETTIAELLKEDNLDEEHWKQALCSSL